MSLFKMIVQEAKITLLRFFETKKFTVFLRVLATVLKIFKANTLTTIEGMRGAFVVVL